jgi:hypothetical protein
MGAGLAWACTPQAYLAPPELRKGSAETELTLKGFNFPPRGHAEVDLNGRHLTTIREPEYQTSYSDSLGSSFTTTVSILNKDLPPGLYTVIAHGYDEDENLASGASKTNSRTFVIEEDKDKAPPAAPVGPTVPDGGKAPPPPGPASPPDGDPIRERTAPEAGSPATAPSASSSDRPTTARSGSGGGTEPTRGGTEPTRGAGDPSRNGGAGRESLGDPGLVTGPSGQPLFKDSLPSPALTDGRLSSGQPSGRSASGDLWSGFGSGRTPSLEPRRGDPATAEEEAGLDIGLAAGTGFLGLGLAALFGSFLIAEVRRRRKAVRA